MRRVLERLQVESDLLQQRRRIDAEPAQRRGYREHRP